MIERDDPLTALCYKADLKYINDNNEYLPDELPEDISECTFAYTPSMLLGVGDKIVTFKAFDEVFDQYVSMYSDKSILPVFTVAEYKGMSESEILSNINDYVALEKKLLSEISLFKFHKISQTTILMPRFM